MRRNHKSPSMRPAHAHESVLLSLALAFGARASFAQAPAAEDSAKPAITQSNDAPFRQQVLHLADGRTLRVKCRLEGDAYRLASESSNSQNQWLPASAVLRSRDVKDLLDEAQRLDKAAGKDPQRRVALADWMMREGLTLECMQELDRVLERAPAQAQALALVESLAQRTHVFQDAKDVKQLLAKAAGTSPVMQELALHEARAKSAGDPDSLRKELGALLESRSERSRALAARGLGRHFPGQDLPDLTVRAVLDGSPLVRQNSAYAMRAAQDEGVIVPVVKALNSSHAVVRENAAQALGDLGYPAALEPLIAHLARVNSAPAAASSDADPPRAHVFFGKHTAYVQDFDVEVAQNAAVADPTVNTLMEGAVLDARVIGVTVRSVAVEAGNIRRSLASLTGANPGSNNRAWLDWWAKNKNQYVAAGRTR